MSESIIVAIIVGLFSTISNIVSSSHTKKMILYRLDLIENKQDKHNGLIERMVVVEQSTKSAHHRIDTLAK